MGVGNFKSFTQPPNGTGPEQAGSRTWRMEVELMMHIATSNPSAITPAAARTCQPTKNVSPLALALADPPRGVSAEHHLHHQRRGAHGTTGPAVPWRCRRLASHIPFSLLAEKGKMPPGGKRVSSHGKTPDFRKGSVHTRKRSGESLYLKSSASDFRGEGDRRRCSSTWSRAGSRTTRRSRPGDPL